ncbi:MAG: bifunctional diaminohydroxyphosphoribosylaminopyrimidine deaminase/5-amino-6-(5-phosphoribosylamino)uracil reductase RibD [Wigglesworthia glossinidia]|nr:bifunctional diaminohydroxyphosphoribosylaminopyrimidine deaminase/5-amino-6-(5-phosphoribosylamino)uracil reductase RibD [Wigglesworthia glossinidia]
MKKFTKKDKLYLSRAFELARLGRFTTPPNPNVGCVIVQKDSIIGEGYHKKAGSDHAEICALKSTTKSVRGSTVYVTLEPCSHYGKTPPCTTALIEAKVKKVIASTIDPNPKISGKGFEILKKSGIQVEYNFMQNIAKNLNPGFFKRMKFGIPWIKLKLASTLDGRTATNCGISKWITSSKARQNVQELRAESDAILSSATSILQDQSKLTVRWHEFSNKIKNIYPKNEIRQPIRIVIDNLNQIKPNHAFIKQNGKILLIRTKEDKLIWPNYITKIILDNTRYDLNQNTKNINLSELMIKLGKLKINNILIESGARLSGAFLNAGLLDEIILYQAPKILGEKARPLFFLSESIRLDNAPKFSISNVCRIGEDVRFNLKPIKRKIKKI